MRCDKVRQRETIRVGKRLSVRDDGKVVCESVDDPSRGSGEVRSCEVEVDVEIVIPRSLVDDYFNGTSTDRNK